MELSSPKNMKDIVIPTVIDETNGYWCEKCGCYHPYVFYNNKLSSSKPL